jgi:hypothetical protein
MGRAPLVQEYGHPVFLTAPPQRNMDEGYKSYFPHTVIHPYLQFNTRLVQPALFIFSRQDSTPPPCTPSQIKVERCRNAPGWVSPLQSTLHNLLLPLPLPCQFYLSPLLSHPPFPSPLMKPTLPLLSSLTSGRSLNLGTSPLYI